MLEAAPVLADFLGHAVGVSPAGLAQVPLLISTGKSPTWTLGVLGQLSARQRTRSVDSDERKRLFGAL